MKWEWHELELRQFVQTSVLQASETTRMRIYVDALDECGEDAAKDLVAFFKRLISPLKSVKYKQGICICFSCIHYPLMSIILIVSNSCMSISCCHYVIS
jgi:hypothetical protein